MTVSRRSFNTLALALTARVHPLRAATGSGEALRAGVERRGIPAAVAMVAGADAALYTCAFGKRDSSGPPAAADSIFGIASMTKPITTVAALQLVESGRLRLDEPVARHLPELEKLQVLDGFEENGKPLLRPPARPILLRHLLTHTSGLVYDTWDEGLKRYNQQTIQSGRRLNPPPLRFDPGDRWQYGTGLDWTGRLVEAVSGQTLEQYFQARILRPLEMKDTTYVLPREKFDRLVSTWHLQPDGAWEESPRRIPAIPKSFNGGGGLYSTAPDYIRFLQMILRRGAAPGGRILSPRSVDLMTANQIGALRAGILHSTDPARSRDLDFHPGASDGFTFGFLINRTAYAGRRSAGSLAWAGIANTFFWIDPRRSLAAVLLMQFLPFSHPEAVGLLADFERAVYATLPA